MNITTRAASALLGAVVALGAVGCVAAAQAPVSEPPVDAEVVAEVVVPTPEPTLEPEVLEPEIIEPVVEPEPEVEVAPPVEGETPPGLQCGDVNLPCDDPEDSVPTEDDGELIPPHITPVNPDEEPLPVGVYVYFDSYDDTTTLIGAGVPCWVDLNERAVCWLDGAIDATIQN